MVEDLKQGLCLGVLASVVTRQDTSLFAFRVPWTLSTMISNLSIERLDPT